MDMVTIGECMAAIRGRGPVRPGAPLELSLAGSESNVAIGLSRLGHRVRWIGVVGDDDLGRMVTRTLRGEGVDVVHRSSSRPTGLVLFQPHVARTTLATYYRTGAAGSELDIDDVRAVAAREPCRILHVTGVTMALGDRPRGAVREAVALAREMGAVVSLDVNFRSRLWDEAAAAAHLRPLLPSIDVLIASDDELGIVSDTADPEELLSLGIQDVVVKLGARGATAHTSEGVLHRPAREVTVLDTVGAGDAFVAGYLSALLDGTDLPGRLERGVSTAAFAVAAHGDWEGLPRREELHMLDATPGSTLR